MFGANPGIFKKASAAEAVALGYAKETQEKWVVVFKRDDEGNDFRYYGMVDEQRKLNIKL